MLVFEIRLQDIVEICHFFKKLEPQSNSYVSYKKNVDDDRKSPSFEFMKILKKENKNLKSCLMMNLKY